MVRLLECLLLGHFSWTSLRIRCLFSLFSCYLIPAATMTLTVNCNFLFIWIIMVSFLSAGTLSLYPHMLANFLVRHLVIIDWVYNFKNLHSKDPWESTFFSLLLPGLSQHQQVFEDFATQFTIISHDIWAQ